MIFLRRPVNDPAGKDKTLLSQSPIEVPQSHFNDTAVKNGTALAIKSAAAAKTSQPDVINTFCVDLGIPTFTTRITGKYFLSTHSP